MRLAKASRKLLSAATHEKLAKTIRHPGTHSHVPSLKLALQTLHVACFCCPSINTPSCNRMQSFDTELGHARIGHFAFCGPAAVAHARPRRVLEILVLCLLAVVHT